MQSEVPEALIRGNQTYYSAPTGLEREGTSSPTVWVKLTTQLNESSYNFKLFKIQNVGFQSS